MKIRKYWVIKFEYTLHIDGALVDRSPEGHPITILTHHAPHLPAGLEALLMGKKPGDYLVSLPPESAYGPYDPAKRVVAQRQDLPEEPRMEGVYTAEDSDGQTLLYRVVEIYDSRIVLDANHKWAGKTLEYRFTVHKVRPADKEEIAHGHVHGEGGVVHQHP